MLMKLTTERYVCPLISSIYIFFNLFCLYLLDKIDLEINENIHFNFSALFKVWQFDNKYSLILTGNNTCFIKLDKWNHNKLSLNNQNYFGYPIKCLDHFHFSFEKESIFYKDSYETDKHNNCQTFTAMKKQKFKKMRKSLLLLFTPNMLVN